MQIQVNEKWIEWSEKVSLMTLKDQHMPTADVVIYNGFQTNDDRMLEHGDRVVFIKKGEKPAKGVFESMLMGRHTPGVHDVLKKATVGVAGVGGLGSNVALALARSGIGRLILADFDVVEPSNLNRQAYFVEHLGMPKTEAIKELIHRANPYVDIDVHRVYVTSENAGVLFKDADILVEAFDQPQAKAELINTALRSLPNTALVAGSGMAGYFSSNTIETHKKMGRLYIVGDQVNEAKPGCGLMAPRVNIAAGHQANMVLRILLGEEKP